MQATKEPQEVVRASDFRRLPFLYQSCDALKTENAGLRPAPREMSVQRSLIPRESNLGRSRGRGKIMLIELLYLLAIWQRGIICIA